MSQPYTRVVLELNHCEKSSPGVVWVLIHVSYVFASCTLLNCTAVTEYCVLALRPWFRLTSMDKLIYRFLFFVIICKHPLICLVSVRLGLRVQAGCPVEEVSLQVLSLWLLVFQTPNSLAARSSAHIETLDRSGPGCTSAPCAAAQTRRWADRDVLKNVVFFGDYGFPLLSKLSTWKQYIVRF